MSWANAGSVWITGVGCASSLGLGLESLKDACNHPKSAFTPTPKEWLNQAGSTAAFMAALSAPSDAVLRTHETVSTDRATAMALLVAEQAWQQAGLESEQKILRERGGVYWGTGMGGLHTTESSYRRQLIDRAMLRPMTVVRIMANASASQLAMTYGMQGPNQTYSVACASSSMALGEAMWAIRSGRLDVVIAGGSEAMLAPVVMTAWGALRVLATETNTSDAAQPCRPFSRDRSGLVIGEGAAAFILESERHARARGATPLAKLVGFATNCDATSMVLPNSNGQIRVMTQALSDAGLLPEQVDSVNAHATSTDAGDAVEAQSLQAVFGSKRHPTVTATKSMHGHLLGATGALEAAMCVASLQTQITPATLGLSPIDQRCAHLNVSDHPRVGAIHTILSNSFAFGGSNASLIFQSAAL